MCFIGINACLVTSVGAEDVLDFNSIEINVIKTRLHHVVLAYTLIKTHSHLNTMNYRCFLFFFRRQAHPRQRMWILAFCLRTRRKGNVCAQ